MNSLPLIILYEPRALFRYGLCAQLQEQGYQVVPCHSLDQLTEEICVETEKGKVLLIGAAGLEEQLNKVLRTLHFSRGMEIKTIVYLPTENELLSRLFIASGANHCLAEDDLRHKLLPLMSHISIRNNRGKHFSISELNVLLDYSSGMQTHDIAHRRHCSYKTVFTFKRNARMRLDIETKAGWMDLLAAIVQLSSYYK